MERVKIWIRKWWYQNIEEFSTNLGVLSYLVCPFIFLFVPDKHEAFFIAIIITFIFVMVALPETWLARNISKVLKGLARIRLFGKR